MLSTLPILAHPYDYDALSREENNDLFILQLPADLNIIDNNNNSSNSNNNNNNNGDRDENYDDNNGYGKDHNNNNVMMMMKKENNRIGKIQLMKSGPYFFCIYILNDFVIM